MISVLAVIGSAMVQSFVASPVAVIRAHLAPRVEASQPTRLFVADITVAPELFKAPVQETASQPSAEQSPRKLFAGLFGLFSRKKSVKIELNSLSPKETASPKPRKETLSCRVDGDDWECRPARNAGGKLRIVRVNGRPVAVRSAPPVIKAKEGRLSHLSHELPPNSTF